MAASRLDISKKISGIENRNSKDLFSLKECFSKNSFSKSLCFTGPAGVGKSSLIAALAQKFSKTDNLIWLACDPSSPKSGGSILGDRIRMSGQDISDSIYIRSFSTRSTQAFSPAVRDVVVYSETLFDRVWIETAGTGQTQSEVAEIALWTVLIMQPETGDEVQSLKSGLRECADIFVINKSDLPGANQLEQDLLQSGVAQENLFVVSTKENRGIDSLAAKLRSLKISKKETEKLKKLQQNLAYGLFLEGAQNKLQKEFKAQTTKWLKNPYSEFQKKLSRRS